MSVRGYAITKVIYHNDMEPFFNLWNNEEFVSAAINMETLNSDGCGVVSISKETLERIIDDQKNDNNVEGKYSDETIEICEKILKLMNKTDEDYINFWCW